MGSVVFWRGGRVYPVSGSISLKVPSAPRSGAKEWQLRKIHIDKADRTDGYNEAGERRTVNLYGIHVVG